MAIATIGANYNGRRLEDAWLDKKPDPHPPRSRSARSPAMQERGYRSYKEH
ncbi:MAG: hypothetical protein WBX30_19090 [Stellaceae bacterium]